MQPFEPFSSLPTDINWLVGALPKFITASRIAYGAEACVVVFVEAADPKGEMCTPFPCSKGQMHELFRHMPKIMAIVDAPSHAHETLVFVSDEREGREAIYSFQYTPSGADTRKN